MSKIINWLKTHKLTTLLLVIVVYFLFGRTISTFFGYQLLGGVSRQRSTVQDNYSGFGGIANPALQETSTFGAPSLGKSVGSILPPSRNEAPPTTDVDERLVVRESNMSLLVENVRQTTDDIINFVEEQGGYMVSSSLTQPEEAPYAIVVVRIPSDNFRSILDNFRQMAIKVTSENITGRDVTDEYVDIEARLGTLEKTKARFEQIMDQAVKIDDILRVQREIINLQSQIDNLKGRQQMLEQTAALSRITIYLSTDEIALPYTPSDTFRPTVIVKQAVRSLIRNLRKISSAAIWLAIYSVIWVPVLIIILVVKRWRAKRINKQQNQ